METPGVRIEDARAELEHDGKVLTVDARRLELRVRAPGADDDTFLLGTYPASSVASVRVGRNGLLLTLRGLPPLPIEPLEPAVRVELAAALGRILGCPVRSTSSPRSRPRAPSEVTLLDAPLEDAPDSAIDGPTRRIDVDAAPPEEGELLAEEGELLAEASGPRTEATAPEDPDAWREEPTAYDGGAGLGADGGAGLGADGGAGLGASHVETGFEEEPVDLGGGDGGATEATPPLDAGVFSGLLEESLVIAARDLGAESDDASQLRRAERQRWVERLAEAGEGLPEAPRALPED